MVELRPITELEMDVLWEFGHEDEFWPFLSRDQESFRTFVQNREAAQWIDCGDICSVYHLGRLVGFVTYDHVAPHELPSEITAVECGTFLLDPYRGIGLNVLIKRALLDKVFRETSCEYALFVILRNNSRAVAAQRKLPWRVEVSNTQGDGLFVKYCRRKTWETSQEAQIFSIQRSDFFLHA